MVVRTSWLCVHVQAVTCAVKQQRSILFYLHATEASAPTCLTREHKVHRHWELADREEVALFFLQEGSGCRNI